MPTFEYCALEYLNLWTSYDKRFVENFTGGKQKMLEIIPEVATVYRVHRNFPLRYDVLNNRERYEPIVDKLAAINIAKIDENNFIKTVIQTRQNIGQEYGGLGVLSATTKFLWMLVRDPIIIYDNNAMTALGRHNYPVDEGNYGQYVQQWQQLYAEKEEEVNEACQGLHGVRLYARHANEIDEQYIQQISAETWFRKRVFDMYLWIVGAE